jgi:hypothetical protein
MNSTFSIGRLTASLPRVGLPTITVRYGSKKPRPDPKSIKPRTPPPTFDPTYGEKIYVFQHTRANHVIYSHTKVIKVCTVPKHSTSGYRILTVNRPIKH